jgi:hypothetical protein
MELLSLAINFTTKTYLFTIYLMEIKTEFLNAYTNEIDKLLSHCNNQKAIIYGLIALISILTFGFVASLSLK